MSTFAILTTVPIAFRFVSRIRQFHQGSDPQRFQLHLQEEAFRQPALEGGRVSARGDLGVFCVQWPFQEPKLEVPTIYKAYVATEGDIPPRCGLIWYGTVPPCKDPGIPIDVWMTG